MRFGLWSPDRCLRLFNRTRANFSEARIHEAVVAGGPLRDLPGSIIHYTFRDCADVFGRMPPYSRAKAAAYRANFSDAAEHFHEGDVFALNAGQLPTADLAWASSPCPAAATAILWPSRGSGCARRART